ncbi:hypothetical protein FIBSPDRAFT_232597 [Athelia psychrophila]|uniref:Uncharacterized protein n=1 Tax=Athelia psychrophila TaxID=1759441 RepID=A0A165WV94_9AGAM|nr:hypothetical protein FIBSPDRAFT_271466 [Fibularhizoctonia sp. CBS 109695]KZP09532.1 hypothetical protein FIBSPDRAFT_232597 [Fibularhizoctonia sp. CBS 109695]
MLVRKAHRRHSAPGRPRGARRSSLGGSLAERRQGQITFPITTRKFAINLAHLLPASPPVLLRRCGSVCSGICTGSLLEAVKVVN